MLPTIRAQRRGIVCTPVLTPEEVLENEHFQSRGTFVDDAEWAPGKTGPIASGLWELDGERQGFRHRAPALGEHDAEAAWSDDRARPSAPRPNPSRPLEGLRVLDFGIGGVGVEAGRLFAEYGADVIKIESRSYPDFMRVVMSTEMSASFASSSRSKRPRLEPTQPAGRLVGVLAHALATPVVVLLEHVVVRGVWNEKRRMWFLQFNIKRAKRLLFIK